MKSNNFLGTLFDNGDWINVCTTKYDTGIKPATYVDGKYQFFSINALHTSRKDANVSRYRSFLIEMDDIPLEDQILILEEFPLEPTTMVYSGGKSVHAIYSLKMCLNSEENWRRYALALTRAINEFADGPVVDKACLNPSRLSRYPGYMRNGDTEQKLMAVNDRIHNDLFYTVVQGFLPKRTDNSERPKKPRLRDTTGIRYSLNGPVAKLLIEGPTMTDGRKNLVFSAARELCGNGVEFEKALDFLEGHTDIDYITFTHQVNSGYKY